MCILIDSPVAQRIRHLTTNKGIPGSNPGRIVDAAHMFVIGKSVTIAVNEIGQRLCRFYSRICHRLILQTIYELSSFFTPHIFHDYQKF